MRLKRPFALHDHFFLFAQGPEGSPHALRVDLRQLLLACIAIASIFATAILGSLLFFREMELNRKLHDKIIELEGELQLTRWDGAPRTVAPAPVERTAALAPATPVTPVAPKIVEAKPITDTVAPEIAPVAAVPAAKPVAAPSVRARIGDFSVDCLDGTCTVRLGMVPTASGMAQGGLLVVLETEVPRIGSGSGVKQEMRKRYFIYPGETSKDDFDPNNLSQFDHKPFKFSRVLQSNIPFEVGQVLRPLGANVYIFDVDGTLVHHERKPIKTDETP